MIHDGQVDVREFYSGGWGPELIEIDEDCDGWPDSAWVMGADGNPIEVEVQPQEKEAELAAAKLSSVGSSARRRRCSSRSPKIGCECRCEK